MLPSNVRQLWDDVDLWNAAFGPAPGGVCWIDATTGHLCRVNEAMEIMVGRTSEELKSISWFEMAHPEDTERLAAAYLDLLRGAEIVSVEGRFLRPDGEVRWGLGTMRLVKDLEGMPAYCDGRLLDITERRASEESARRAWIEAEEAANSKETFLASMSHELRTPLNAVIGLSSILRRQTFGELSEKQSQMVGQIETAGRNLLELINNVLDFAKMRSADVDVTLERAPVAGLVEDAVSQMRETAMGRNIAVIVGGDPLLEVTADVRRVKQVVVQLLSNAIKFSPDGAKVDVGFSAVDGGVEIAVADFGIGIDADKIDRLFQPFSQADESLARASEGSGLGLALCREIVDLHGGNISVTSTPGVGSRFAVFFPTVVEKETEEEPPADGPEPDTGRLKGTVLVVEDNETNRTMLKDYLETLGVDVPTAVDGLDALEKTRELAPDVVLMDVQMPRMDGLAATEALAADPDTSSIPIVALTAMAVRGDAERCLAAGCIGYLSKPVDLDELVATLRRYLPT